MFDWVLNTPLYCITRGSKLSHENQSLHTKYGPEKFHIWNPRSGSAKKTDTKRMYQNLIFTGCMQQWQQFVARSPGTTLKSLRPLQSWTKHS